MNTVYNYIYDDYEIVIIAIPKDKLYMVNNKKFKSVNSLLQFCSS